jgi:ADP-heptose:LPS heptosyltransferase
MDEKPAACHAAVASKPDQGKGPVGKRLKFACGCGIYAFRKLAGNFYPSRANRGNVLLINTSGIGDVIASTSVIDSVRKNFPGRRIGFVTHRGAESVLRGNPLVDALFVVEGSRLRDILKYRLFCRKFSAEYAIALDPGYRNGLLCLLASSSNFAWFPRDDRLMVGRGRKVAVERIKSSGVMGYASAAVRRFGCAGDGAPQIPILPANRIPQHGRPIVLFIGGKWEWKRWDVINFAKLAVKLSEGSRVLICGGKGDEALMQRACRLVNGSPAIGFHTCSNIQQLASVIQQARLLVTSDTVAVHVATAVRTRSIILFGPTVPERVLPQDSFHLPLSKGLPCQPCYSVAGGKGRCVQKIQSLCLKSFTAEEVAGKVHSMINRS